MSEIIYKFTGNPFVDAGVWAICQWVEKRKPEDLDKEDLKNMIENIVPLYFENGWIDNMQSLFPNNPVINPAVSKEFKNKSASEKKEYKKKKYKDYLVGLLNETVPLNNPGNCISCGCRNVGPVRTKTEVPLIGSGTLINFFPSGQSGGDYCPACTFAIQFSPLFLYQCKLRGKIFLLIHSNLDNIMYSWSKKAINEIRRQILMNDYTGCFNENFTNPRNALFHIIQDIIIDYDTNWFNENPSINLYHFTNYNQGPELDMYHVPTSVFRFLAYVKLHEKYADWEKIVKKGYWVNWNKLKDGEDYKNKTNSVYNNLLENKSIIRYFFNRKNREVIGDWDLFTFYLEKVRKMDQKRLETLKRVGSELSEYIKSTENTKRLVDLERAGNYGSFRNVLRKIIKDRIKSNADKPLFSLEEYIEDLFPDGNLGWRETQDLLLFKIYENLHGWLKNKELPENDVEEEISNDKK